MTKGTRAVFDALPITVLVTVLAGVLLDGVSYVAALWGESELEQIGAVPASWGSGHEQALVLVATALAIPLAAYLGYKFFRLAVSAERERLID